MDQGLGDLGLCQNSLEISWNLFQHANHQFHPPMSHGEQWMGPTLKLLQTVPICVEIWHGSTRHIPWRYVRVSRLKDAWCPRIIFEIFHICINIHHAVSLSSFVIHIYGIFDETLLKFHGTYSNTPITNVIHQCSRVRSEWGQCWNFFKCFLHASKFDMVRLDTCLDGMQGYQDWRIFPNMLA